MMMLSFLPWLLLIDGKLDEELADDDTSGVCTVEDVNDVNDVE